MTNKNKTAKFSLKKSLFLASISLLSVAPALVAISCKDPKKEEKGVKYESFINPDLSNSAVLEKFEKYNQIHILSEIKEYFDKVDTSELFIFKNGAKPENIPFNNMMKNNFLIKNAEFNEKKFKEIVKKQFKLSDKFIERFKFKIDYNNTYFDPGNYFDVLIPVDVKLYLENHNKAEYHKGMFINQPIKLRIKNVKNQEIEKNTEFKEVYKKINELKDEDFKINVNDFESKKETLELIEKWGINELNSEQIASIFDLKNEKFDAIKQSAEQGKKLSLKMTAFGVDFYDKELKENEGFLKIRVGVITSTKDKNKTPEAGKTFRIKFTFNNKTLSDIKLSESIKVNTIFHGEINTDHATLKKDNLIFKSYNKSIKKIELAEHKTESFRRTKIILNVTLEGKDKPVKVVKFLGTKKRSLLYEEEFTKKNIVAPNFATDRITTTNLASIKKDFFSTYNSYIFSGGYGISRGFYGNDNIKTPLHLHFGEDYLAPDYQPVLMPYDGEIIAAFDLKITAAWQGVGTVVVLRIPVSNLDDWSPKEKEIYLGNNKSHIYMSYLHLDPEKTLNNPELGFVATPVAKGNRAISVVTSVTPTKTSKSEPKKVKKGTIIGYLGPEGTNGGWMSHAHVNLYSNRTQYLSPNYFFTEQENVLVNDNRVNGYYDESKDTYNTFGNVGVKSILANKPIEINETNPLTGEEKTVTTNGKKGKDKIKVKGEFELYKNNLSITEQEIKGGYLNPNIVYDLRNDKTISFGIEEFFNLNKK